MVLPILPVALASLLLTSCSDTGPQGTDCPTVDRSFAEHAQATLRDTTDLFKGAYPLAPALTCPILIGLQAELQDDSAAYHYDRMGMAYWPQHVAYGAAIGYFERHHDAYALLAVSTHWNHDQKIHALRAYQRLVRLRPLICTTKEGQERLERQDTDALRFLLDALESTPLRISGSENATIHGVYMRELMITLDLLTGEHLVPDDVELTTINDLRYESMVLRWKDHLK